MNFFFLVKKAVLEAMGKPSPSHVAPQFIETFGKCIEQLRRVFLTAKGQPFVLAGSGTLAWDMTACNLLEKGDKALVVSTGYFSEGFADCLEAYGATVTKLEAPVGDCPTLDALSEALSAEEKPYRLVTLTHVDTSTGVFTDVKAFAERIRQLSPQTLIVVDGVCASAAEELRMDEWDVDVVVTASQKAIGVPPGLAILIASERAMNHFQQRTTPVANYFCDWKRWLPIMQSYERRQPSYFATPPVNLIQALSVSLDEIVEQQGMEARFKQHRECAARFRKAVKQGLGLEVVPVREELQANTITAIRYPQGIKGPELLVKLKEKGIIAAGGIHRQIRAEYFRIGHMGVSVMHWQENKHLEKTVRALQDSLKELGHSFPENAAVSAFLE
ncbi:alanine--glyoxylate transaminase [Balamuthia mandrillaris]